MASLPVVLRAQRIPNNCGSRIWVASSMMATSNVFSLNNSGLPEIEATVPTNIRQRVILSTTSERRLQRDSSFSIRWLR